MTRAGAAEREKTDGHDGHRDREEGRHDDVSPHLPRLVHEAMMPVRGTGWEARGGTGR
ncbi:hypothetical protein GCM10017559_25490 [Streptosporangium longisporum]|uniref:Uncharacterized protein n=1 Tax=Streptosporangium longisporum TaxID=46187 RepID=A0ABP6KGB7_9ACTN